ncbi:MAG: RdgB/HAM1 family non-canonical purine NTP pyrophosphatase [Clostridiales bacterium]|nr:RdgB/HAM1 family non-canonical purine NTP pyrophosphatase [Clostridiales bacterium]
MDYIVATHNLKKRDELVRILSPLGISIHLPEELGFTLTDVEETGETFEENAFIKAESACKETGMPCIADDSGLAVDYLGGAPGIFSARYSGIHGDDDANNKKLLKALEGVDDSNRGAAYVAAICCVYPDGRCLTSRGECRGRIGYEEIGTGGFGYDPLFWPEEYGFTKTMANLTAEEKDKISHRGAAIRAIAEKIGDKI